MEIMDVNKEGNVNIHSIISSIQKIALYETKSHFYIMGSNNSMTRFRVLKIDRSEPKELVVTDDKKIYTQEEIKQLVTRISVIGKGTSSEQKISPNGISKSVSAFGIVGFVRFMEGYYIILITKRRRVAVIGNHSIYKIEDTALIYIPNDSVRLYHPDEQKYVKMFQSVDLNSNFYFSYSYDISHSLQYNISLLNSNYSDISSTIGVSAQTQNISLNYGVRTRPHERFVWNMFLLSSVAKKLHSEWFLYIIHGFIGQSNVSVFGKSIFITLLARRSNKYAGTRFLKRGANIGGDVANEVETEQIVHSTGISSLSKGDFSSFIQMRGSVPGLWSQDISKMVPKPTITIDLTDPFVEITGAHLNQLLYRYGSPIIILNLVKKRESKKHESILTHEINTAVKYLNQFLPPEHYIQYLSFDMARKNKGKEANVMGRLADIANSAVLKTKIFISRPSQQTKLESSSNVFNFKKMSKNDSNSSLPKSSSNNSLSGYDLDDISLKVKQCFNRNQNLQTGVIRTNCVDCLDRTNTAQFAIGKCALGFQLCSLGILDSPKLEFDSDCVRMLEELYEDHGDTLALQYGGSQLVHRIKTYRKTAPWTSQGNDIMQTLSRYYSNTFSDQEKQHSINLFLGLFIPEEGKNAIWDFVSDYHLHYNQVQKMTEKMKYLTQWWDKNVLNCLPYSCQQVEKKFIEAVFINDMKEEVVDLYYDFYRPFELSLINSLYLYQTSHSTRDFMPHFTTDFSPFTVRVRPGRRREKIDSKNIIKSPSLTGHSSTSSTTSSDSSSIDSSSNGDERQEFLGSHNYLNNSDIMSNSYFSELTEIYGKVVEYPKRSDVLLYKKAVLVNKMATYNSSRRKNQTFLLSERIDNYKMNVNVDIYENHVNKFSKNPTFSVNETNFYRKYVQKNKLNFNFIQCDLKF